MNRPLLFTPEAELELNAIADNYHTIRPELGLKFNRAVDIALAWILAYPLAWSKTIGKSRRVKLPRFPYHIYYKPRRERLVVWAVFHAHRDLKPLKRKEARA